MIDNLVTAAGLACFLFGLFVFFSADAVRTPGAQHRPHQRRQDQQRQHRQHIPQHAGQEL